MAVAHNQAFLDAVVRAQRGTTGYPLPPEPDRSAAGIAKIRSSQPTTAPRYFSKAKSSLHQLVREWASEGAAERASCYGVLLAQLQRFLPVTDANRYAACSVRRVVRAAWWSRVMWSCGRGCVTGHSNRQRVACPGSGLGRLPLEVAAHGYAAQGNEFSYQMLMMGHYMLNQYALMCAAVCVYLSVTADVGRSMDAAECATVFPWIDSPNNLLSVEDGVRPVLLPDISPSDYLASSTCPARDRSLRCVACWVLTVVVSWRVWCRKPRRAGLVDGSRRVC